MRPTTLLAVALLAGAAVTLLNWSGEPVESLKLSVRIPFPVRSVDRVTRGPVTFATANGVVCGAVPPGVGRHDQAAPSVKDHRACHIVGPVERQSL